MESYTKAVDMFDKAITNIYDNANRRIGMIKQVAEHKFEADSTERPGIVVFLSEKNALLYILAQLKSEKEVSRKEKGVQKRINWYV